MSRIKPKKGDLIEIFRGAYQHWAIYVGNGYVIHLTSTSEVAGAGSSSLMSVFSDRAVVKKEKLLDVVGGDEYQINNLLDDEYEPRDIEVIVDEAENLVDQTRRYSLFYKNCEHFVTGLRYGKPESRQVRNAVAVVKVAIPPVRVLDEAAIGPVRVRDLVALGPVGFLGAVAFGSDVMLDAAASVASALLSDKDKKNKY